MLTKYYFMYFSNIQKLFLTWMICAFKITPKLLGEAEKGMISTGHSCSWWRAAQLPHFHYISESQEKQQRGNKPKLVTADLVYFCIASLPAQKWCVCQPLTRAANWNVACSGASSKDSFSSWRELDVQIPSSVFVPTSPKHVHIISLPCSSQDGHEWNED